MKIQQKQQAKLAEEKRAALIAEKEKETEEAQKEKEKNATATRARKKKKLSRSKPLLQQIMVTVVTAEEINMSILVAKALLKEASTVSITFPVERITIAPRRL
ncbi:hypothetical protein [Listeria rocourtiae]|uniref:hypothetical protein n=1 Tax=Listeria rocourtiae TaxID=647910 RepID=UPI0003E8A2CD|nr:hypothetical protein [Listeria rocourtiae]EUJ47377.1 hypothetical protein PROCOU_09791 [Listeria rocourtiae FSL F6-920]